ncbi:MAG: hypothetical protein Fur0044_44600 [Anaerolineae bacterium]
MPLSSPAPATWLVQTKLYPPRLRDDIVLRPRLLTALQQALDRHALTLISAPPGYGKTTLLAALCQQKADGENLFQPSAFSLQPFSAAWLSLDEDDNDPDHFFAALVAAVQRLCPGCGQQAEALLAGSSRLPAAETLRRAMGSLSNELLAWGQPMALMLDDFHLITDPAIHQALDYFVEHLPPTVRLVIAARYAPPLALARLRARGYLAEFRLDDLRFTDQEVALWLNERLGLHLPGESLRLLQQHTEGWATGVRLLTLSLGQSASAAECTALLTRLNQSQRHVFDFLADEVLRYQEAPLRRFLLETSILSELTPALCGAVTGQPEAPALLEEVYRRNLFITLTQTPTGSATDPGLAYRYHTLFAHFLRRQLSQEMPEQVRLLHRRAAEAHPLPGESIRHYLAAELWSEAAQTIETLGRQQLERGSLSSVRRWIELLPEAARHSSPWLNLFLGADDVNRGHYETARPWLETARRGFAATGDTAGQAETLVQLGEVFVCLADVSQARPILEESLTFPLPLARRVKSQVNLVWTAFYQRDWPQFERNLAGALSEVLASGDKGAYQSVVLSLGPQYVFTAAGAAPIEQFCRRVLALFGEGVGPAQAGALAYLGYIYALQGRPADALQAASQAQAMVQELGSFAHLELYIDHVFLLDALNRSDETTFNAYFDRIRSRIEGVLTYRQWLACYSYLAGRMAWQHRHDEAMGQVHSWLMATIIPHELPEAQVGRLLLDSLLARRQQRYVEAEASLHQAIAAQSWLRHPLLMTDARLTLADLYLEWNRPEAALAELRPALAELEQRGMPGVLAQEGPRAAALLRLAQKHHLTPALVQQGMVLLGLDAAPATFVLPGGESLSARELEVLHLLALGLTNQEIAQELVIAPGTAKRHTINIYGKLGVNNRTQAVARARALRLI